MNSRLESWNAFGSSVITSTPRSRGSTPSERMSCNRTTFRDDPVVRATTRRPIPPPVNQVGESTRRSSESRR
ncbi:hypothetical protein QFW96_25320 [Saccharopolyspora sp. TS4A08]|uniref:Uncharacterized protein n=1 Tax=Saccharopolyspora ipomoeae TaxID=3042027 RepID=A0ABT6PVC9_9PSEU|nr:hypothetical protein [Saccharopolyspora sp. TS4A08]MDI2031968.1 hypothetical protein [Saccharopolyspora sp. TS4A08]